jgi:pimeloyl-ACP methyl ester carboxylesterase
LIAYIMGSMYPDQIAKAVILDSPGKVFTPDDYDALLKRFGREELGSLLVPDGPDGVQELIDLAYYRSPSVPKFAKQQVLDELYSSDREEKKQLLSVLFSQMYELKNRPEDLQAQTLLIWGSDDPIFPVEIGQRLDEYLGDKSRLEVIPKAKHAPNLEHHGKVDRLIHEFLAE